jgi:hypothetical protein
VCEAGISRLTEYLAGVIAQTPGSQRPGSFSQDAEDVMTTANSRAGLAPDWIFAFASPIISAV